MRAIDIFEFRDMFRCVRSAAFVGNASSVTSWNNGKVIDSYDMVVRYNRARTNGLEKKIGTKTDVLVSNDINSLDIAPSPAETLAPKCVVAFVKPKSDFDTRDLKEWVGDIPHVISLGPDIVGTHQAGRTRSLTMGTYSLYTFLRLFRFESLFITGFTMFGIAPGGGEKYYQEKKNSYAGTYHDLDHEAVMFAEILRQYDGELRMTPEVEKLVNRNAALTSPHSRTKNLKAHTYQFLSRRFMKLGLYFRRRAEKNKWLYDDQESVMKR